MPLIYQVDFGNKLLIANATGTLTFEDLFTYQHQAWARKEVRGFDELVDITGAETIGSISTEVIRHLSDLAATTEAGTEPSRLAIVAPRDLEYGLARIFQVYRETHPESRKVVRVFRSLKEAMAYLGAGHTEAHSKST